MTKQCRAGTQLGTDGHLQDKLAHLKMMYVWAMVGMSRWAYGASTSTFALASSAVSLLAPSASPRSVLNLAKGMLAGFDKARGNEEAALLGP